MNSNEITNLAAGFAMINIQKQQQKQENKMFTNAWQVWKVQFSGRRLLFSIWMLSSFFQAFRRKLNLCVLNLKAAQLKPGAPKCTKHSAVWRCESKATRLHTEKAQCIDTLMWANPQFLIADIFFKHSFWWWTWERQYYVGKLFDLICATDPPTSLTSPNIHAATRTQLTHIVLRCKTISKQSNICWTKP